MQSEKLKAVRAMSSELLTDQEIFNTKYENYLAFVADKLPSGLLAYLGQDRWEEGLGKKAV